MDLVYALLKDADSSYFSDPANDENYTKQQIRLKTLVSQLLSPHVSRLIPPDFLKALQTVTAKRLNDPVLAEEILKQVNEDLKQKNRIGAKGEISRPLEILRHDFKHGNYIALITSVPLEIEAENFSESFSMRELFLTDFIDHIDPTRIFTKKYRLIFPVRSSCTLFWKGLKQVTYKHLKKSRNDQSLLLSLRQYLNPTSNVQHDLFNEENIGNEYLYDLTIRLLTYLNKEGFIKVFLHETPLFNLPVIAINPAELKNAKVYTILKSEKEESRTHKYTFEELILWRHFVWDRLKMHPFSGEAIVFSDSENNEID